MDTNGTTALVASTVAKMGLVPRNVGEALQVAEVLARSGFFKDAREAEQAFAKICYGAELGIGPVSSMQNIHYIDGKMSPAPALMAAVLEKSGRYMYRVVEHTETACTLEFFRLVSDAWESLGVSEFTMDDAKKAGLAGRTNWQKYPRNMLFARAMGNGVKWYTPDLFGGQVYTPDELGEETDEDGVPTSPPPLPQLNPRRETKPEPKPEPVRPQDDPLAVEWLRRLQAAEGMKEEKTRLYSNLCTAIGRGDEEMKAAAVRACVAFEVGDEPDFMLEG